jgi:hypothetical protein
LPVHVGPALDAEQGCLRVRERDLSSTDDGYPIVSGAWVKILRVRDKHQNRKSEIQSRNWSFIAPETINDWFVRLSEEPPTPDAKVVLQVTRSDGSPDEQTAENLRTVIRRDGRPARAPSQEEMDHLVGERMNAST